MCIRDRDGTGTPVFRTLMVEVHTDTLTIPDKDTVLAVPDVFAKLVVQKPFEVDYLGSHPCPDMHLFREITEPLIGALQRIKAALHEQDEPASRQVMRNQAVHGTVYGQLISCLLYTSVPCHHHSYCSRVFAWQGWLRGSPVPLRLPRTCRTIRSPCRHATAKWKSSPGPYRF